MDAAELLECFVYRNWSYQPGRRLGRGKRLYKPQRLDSPITHVLTREQTYTMMDEPERPGHLILFFRDGDVIVYPERLAVAYRASWRSFLRMLDNRCTRVNTHRSIIHYRVRRDSKDLWLGVNSQNINATTQTVNQWARDRWGLVEV